MSRKGGSCPDEVVLSIFDTAVHQRDVDLLEGSNWINDVLIGFYYEYLAKDKFGDQRSEFALLDPDVAFACSSGETVAVEFTKDLRLPEKQFVFLPINDNSVTFEAGGSHWSLLFYNRKENTFHVLDSGNGHNNAVARKTARNLELALQTPSIPHVVNEPVSQQHNYYDCGVYLMCFTEMLLENHLRGSNLSLSEISPEYISHKRIEIRELIYRLREIF